MNEVIKVNMSGKEYMEWKERGNLRLPKITKKEKIIGLMILGLFTAILCIGYLLIDIGKEKTINESDTWDMIWTGFNYMPMFLVTCIGLGLLVGWAFHGVGFYIIRR